MKLRKKRFDELVEELSQEVYALAYSIDADGFLEERREELKKIRPVIREILKGYRIKY